MNTALVELFCTPPTTSLTGFDQKVLSGAKRSVVPFEDQQLSCYSWGEGKTVLLVHGWGSRASHMALLGRSLARAGFRAIGFDAPAHSSVDPDRAKPTSNMFEYCRAIATVLREVAPVHAVVGHSLGAIASVYAPAGIRGDAREDARVGRVILVSTPPSVEHVVRAFCRRNGLDTARFRELRASLEESFQFSIDAFDLRATLAETDERTLIVHDRDDEEFPYSEAHSLVAARPGIEMFESQGCGHEQILFSRRVHARIVQFLE